MKHLVTLFILRLTLPSRSMLVRFTPAETKLPTGQPSHNNFFLLRRRVYSWSANTRSARIDVDYQQVFSFCACNDYMMATSKQENPKSESLIQAHITLRQKKRVVLCFILNKKFINMCYLLEQSLLLKQNF